MVKIHVRVKTIEDKIFEYVDSHQEDIYINYNDKLSTDQVRLILDGEAEDVRDNIEIDYTEGIDLTTYWKTMCEELGCTMDDVDDWLAADGYLPYHNLSDHEWKQLLRNTNVYITATLWDADWNFNNWAYGGPVTYSDVKESLKVLGINPLEFKKLMTGGSMTSGTGKLRGYFPDMPNRIAKVDVKELWENMSVLYDGVLNFCLGDLENIAEVLKDNPKNITFKKGTNVVMYNFNNGAGITELPLTGDVTVPRSKIEFRIDSDNRMGIQACYGFVHKYWEEGSIQSMK